MSTFSPLAAIPAVWGWFALLVWGLTFVGTVRAAASVLSAGLRSGPGAVESA